MLTGASAHQPGHESESLTYFDVQNMVRTDSLATVVVELLDVYGNRQSLQFLTRLGVLADPLRGSW